MSGRDPRAARVLAGADARAGMSSLTHAVKQALATSPTASAVASRVSRRGPRKRARFADTARALLRNTLLDVVEELLTDRTWSEIKMAEVARNAGVSRQTLYKEFGSREGFAQAYILREADRHLAAVDEVIRARRDDPEAALAAGVETFLVSAAKDPMIKAIVAGEHRERLLSLVTNQAGPVLRSTTERLGEILAEIWPTAAPRAVASVADLVVRLAVSHTASPSATPADTAAAMAEVFGPYLRQAVGD